MKAQKIVPKLEKGQFFPSTARSTTHALNLNKTFNLALYKWNSLAPPREALSCLLLSQIEVVKTELPVPKTAWKRAN